MKKALLIGIILTSAVVGCRKNQTGNLCIVPDKSSASVGETVNVANCGDTPPAEYVESTIDWGDGAESEGLDGTHTYSAAGTYTIRAMVNGDPANEVTDSEEANVAHTITIQ